MPWVRLDDQFPNHPKVVGVGPLGIALQVAGLCYSNRYLTDGLIPAAAVPTLIDFSELDEHAFNGRGGVCWIAVGKLVSAGLWEEAPGGYTIHDYLTYQASRSQVLKEREDARERKRRNSSPVVRPNFDRTSPVSEESSLPPTPTPTPTPSEPKKVPQGSPPRAPHTNFSLVEPPTRPKKGPPTAVAVGISDEFRQTVLARFSAALGGETAVAEEIERALAHKAARSYAYPQEAYVRGWLNREAKKDLHAIPGANGRRPGQRAYDDMEEVAAEMRLHMAELEEAESLRARRRTGENV